MEKVSLKELYQRFTADKKGTQKLFISSEYVYETYQIKNIAPNPRKAEAISAHDEYADYVPDFDFEVTNANSGGTCFLDGHAGSKYYMSSNKDELNQFNLKRLEDECIEDVNREIQRIKVPKCPIIGERTAHLNELLGEFRATIEKITNYTNAG